MGSHFPVGSSRHRRAGKYLGSGRDLLGHESQPGGEVATLGEPLAGSDRGDHGGSMIGPMPGTLIRRSHPASRLASSSISPDNPLDALIKPAPVRGQFLDDTHHAGGKHIGRCGQNARQLHPQEALSLSHRDAPFQEADDVG